MNQKEIFVILSTFNFPVGFSKIPAGAAYTASIHAAARRHPSYSYFGSSYCKIIESLSDKFYDQLLKEYQYTGTIAGYEVYCVNENFKVWVSKNDFKIIQEIESWPVR